MMFKKVITYFDLEQLSSFEALRMLLGSTDPIVGDNLRLAYSATNSKFYPIPISESVVELKTTNGGFEHHLNKYGKRFVRLFYLLIQDDQLRYLRNKKVYQFISTNNVTNEIDELTDKYLSYALSYKTNRYNTRYLNYELKNNRKIIERNINLIKDNFEYAKAYVNVIEKDNKINFEIIPDSTIEIKFNNLKIHLNEDYYGRITFIYDNGNDVISKQSVIIKDKTNLIDLMMLVEDLYFSGGLDEDLFPEKRTYKLEFVFEDAEKVLIEDLDISMRNDITGEDIGKYDTYVQIADGSRFFQYNIINLPFYLEFYPFRVSIIDS